MLRIGMITPSSNTIVEPVTGAMIAPLLDEVSVHYARIEVTKISLEDDSLNQFALEAMLSAARLLADARVHMICWNGTSAAWKGGQADREICDAIKRDTGIPATTSTLGQLDAFKSFGVARYGLAVPYLESVCQTIQSVYANEGFECVQSSHLGISVNFDFAEVNLDTIRDLIRRADSPSAQAISVICTNLAAARVVDEMELKLGKPIFDSLVLALWHPLRLLGWSKPIRGWGRLMAEVASAV